MSRIIITGATGMVGGYALQACLDSDAVTAVTTVGRRKTGIAHPKLTEIEHADFADLGPIEASLAGYDAALFCLGTYTGAVDDDLFRRITVDYAVQFAEALRRRSPEAAFCLLSGQGADQQEKSRMAFARYKGQAENALKQMGFPRVHLFRPGYIYPNEPRDEPNISYRIFRFLWPALRRVWPNAGIDARGLAGAMLHAALHGTDRHTAPELENRDIRRIAAGAG